MGRTSALIYEDQEFRGLHKSILPMVSDGAGMELSVRDAAQDNHIYKVLNEGHLSVQEQFPQEKARNLHRKTKAVNRQEYKVPSELKIPYYQRKSKSIFSGTF